MEVWGAFREKPQESEKSRNNQTGYNAEINGEQD